MSGQMDICPFSLMSVSKFRVSFDHQGPMIRTLVIGALQHLPIWFSKGKLRTLCVCWTLPPLVVFSILMIPLVKITYLFWIVYIPNILRVSLFRLLIISIHFSHTLTLILSSLRNSLVSMYTRICWSLWG